LVINHLNGVHKLLGLLTIRPDKNDRRKETGETKGFRVIKQDSYVGHRLATSTYFQTLQCDFTALTLKWGKDSSAFSQRKGKGKVVPVLFSLK
jgi:hypothetical protein